MTEIILSLVYAIGYALCFCMLRIEQEADRELYTKGDRVACVFISLLSWVSVLGLLIAAWVRMVRESGYWNRPVNVDVTMIQGTEASTKTLNAEEDDE